MRRVKLKIKRLESTSNRQVTYSKRRNGILKKAKELSILCDIDIVLLMFSLTGKATLSCGEHREDVYLNHLINIPLESRRCNRHRYLVSLLEALNYFDFWIDVPGQLRYRIFQVHNNATVHPISKSFSSSMILATMTIACQTLLFLLASKIIEVTSYHPQFRGALSNAL
ncbi:Agamous-like MADS-box protein AGL65 [Camellia lanceoleosa]|uniref:Agamous-like MADS-box protein AGL65 n=1 Tax=Camellia lanceoleosa TaxID=1840588 RepID=A0ACC0F8P4_9ERIC|nr:Agamous-like MADS-box protein AGL65 [Camellia lanceoleosa]